jgi:hypothetical protein
MKSNTKIAATFSTIGAGIKRAAALVAVLTILVAGAAAQSSKRMLVSVPFAFAAGKTTMPAGDYVVTRRGSNVLEIRGAEGAALITTAPLAVDQAGERAQVVFNRYDTGYVLAAVQTLDGSMRLKGSRAKDGAPSEIVAILAK